MSSISQKILALPLEKRALLALKAAVKKAIAERKRERLPVYIWSGGKVVDITRPKARTQSRRSANRTQRVDHT